MSGARLSQIALRVGWKRIPSASKSGHIHYSYDRDEVLEWVKANDYEHTRTMYFITLCEAVDSLGHDPSREEMEGIARHPFTWKDVESLVETRHYREEAKGRTE
jgi:hypothetical protein